MKDQNIKLPELPVHDIFDAGAFMGGVRVMAVETAQSYACAAIEPYAKRIAELEADRKRRGEPVLVGWAVGTTGGGLLHASKYTEHEARDAGYSLPLYRLTSPQPAEPVKCSDPSMGEHACSNRAQCWEPCGELGSSIEHAKVAEPVKVPLPHGFNTGNEKLDALLDDTFYLAKDGGMDNAIKWQESLEEFLASIEPVKVPSDGMLMMILDECGALTTANTVRAIRLALDRYGQQAQTIAPANDDPTPEEEEAWQRMERRS